MKIARHTRRGFTLIELMIVVAIIGILAAIAIPKFADLLRKSTEGQTKGSLATLRSALSVYYADLEGQYPSDMASMTVAAKYVSAIPTAKAPDYHPTSAAILNADVTVWTDVGGWHYDNLTGTVNQGLVSVNCTHTDTRGLDWSTY